MVSLVLPDGAPFEDTTISGGASDRLFTTEFCVGVDTGSGDVVVDGDVGGEEEELFIEEEGCGRV